MTGDAAGTAVMYLPKEKVLATGDLLSFPVPYYTPQLGRHARSLKILAHFDATTIIPGHGAAEHDKTSLNLELTLFERIVNHVTQVSAEGFSHG